jgi:hypothetical protein
LGQLRGIGSRHGSRRLCESIILSSNFVFDLFRASHCVVSRVQESAPLITPHGVHASDAYSHGLELDGRNVRFGGLNGEHGTFSGLGN